MDCWWIAGWKRPISRGISVIFVGFLCLAPQDVEEKCKLGYNKRSNFIKVVTQGSVFEYVVRQLSEVFPLAVKYNYQYHVQLQRPVCKLGAVKADEYSYMKLCWTLNKHS